MRKRLPMSALITGLLAAPVLGATGLSTPNAAVPAITEAWVETFPSEMPAGIAERMRRIARGEKLNAFGMQGLHSRMMRLAQTRIVRRREEGIVESISASELVPVQAGKSWGNNTPPLMTLVAATEHVEKIAYLGVGPLPAPEALHAQLNLPRDMGLLVDLIDENSPADKAGIKKNDVLVKLDDQWLVNVPQMQVLIHSKKPGETITLSLIRGGKATDIKVTLGEKDTMVADTKMETTKRFSASTLTMNADGSIVRRLHDDESDITLTRDKTGTATVAVKDHQGKLLFDGPAAEAGKTVSAELAKKVTDLMNAPNEVRIEVHAGAGRGNSYTLERNDAAHEVSVKVDEKGRHLTVKELATGKTLFDGPADREEDYKSLPAPVLQKVKEAMEKVK